MNSAIALSIPDDFLPRHSNVQLRATKPFEAVMLELDALHAADKAAEQLKSKLKPWLWVTGIATGLGFIFVFPFVMGIPFAILLYKYFQAEKRDVEDRRLNVARHLLRTLETEVNPGANVVLEMDFRGYDKGSKTTANTFRQQWMRLAVVLKNGAALQITAITHCKRKSKRKRKYTKLKDKLREELTLDIQPAKGAPFQASQTQRVAKVLAQPVPMTKLRRCRLRPRAAQITFLTEVAVHTQPAGRVGVPFSNRQAFLDAEKVLTLTTMGYRAAAHATGPAA